MSDQPDWKIMFDVQFSSFGGSEPCIHCYDHKKEIPKKRSDGSIYNNDEMVWTCPKVVKANNEGGYNATYVCLDCILEKAE